MREDKRKKVILLAGSRAAPHIAVALVSPRAIRRRATVNCYRSLRRFYVTHVPTASNLHAPLARFGQPDVATLLDMNIALRCLDTLCVSFDA